ncbi:SDR family oxidoreductase [Candidatus Saccharibacteria bacterium]|nr:SDR family oxidoreductase [Candidatus Saccharibacteria bacterium]
MSTIQELISLQGKSAIVTGGAKGIGQGIAYRLAEAGASILIADLDTVAAEATAQDMTSKGWKASAFTVDVSDEQQVKAMVDSCQEQFGGVDILVNNAGIFPQSTIASMAVDLFDKVMSINLRSVFLATKYASEVMKTKGQGKIINITSIDALHPSMVGLAHYDASKHGVWGFTKNAALELAEHNIWVNAVAPGGIATPGVADLNQGVAPDEGVTKAFLAKIPMHRMGEPDEIGKVVLFLASDMASYMTGQQVVVDGGALLT